MASKNLELLADISGQPLEDLERVTRSYPFALTPFIMNRVKDGSYTISALRQFLPAIQELHDIEGFSSDPTGESGLHPEQAVLQTYNNRLALILSYQCLVYCRFCFRKAAVGPGHDPTELQLEKALTYIATHPEIEDVLLSGGDPLALPNKKLLPFLEKLTSYPHVKAIRIDSRALNVHPDRFDDELLAFLEKDGRFWYYAHLNHPDDIDHPAVLAVVRKLLSARIPIYNQSVILAGVNDDVETMKRLMNLCYFNKVIPYNLYVLDRVKGGAHFDVPAERVAEIYTALSDLSGPAQPLLVYVDAESKKHRAIYDTTFNVQAFLETRKTATDFVPA